MKYFWELLFPTENAPALPKMIIILILLIYNVYIPVSQQTYSCYCCSIVFLDHTTLLCMTCPTYLIGYILPNT